MLSLIQYLIEKEEIGFDIIKMKKRKLTKKEKEQLKQITKTGNRIARRADEIQSVLNAII